MAGFGDATARGGGQPGTPAAERRMESGDAPGTELAAGLPSALNFIPRPLGMSAAGVTRERAERASRRSGAGQRGPASDGVGGSGGRSPTHSRGSAASE